MGPGAGRAVCWGVAVVVAAAVVVVVVWVRGGACRCGGVVC